jgi:hypothetical protein
MHLILFTLDLMGNNDGSEEFALTTSGTHILALYETAHRHNLIRAVPYLLCPNNLYLKNVSRSMHYAEPGVRLPLWHHGGIRYGSGKNFSQSMY